MSVRHLATVEVFFFVSRRFAVFVTFLFFFFQWTYAYVYVCVHACAHVYMRYASSRLSCLIS